MFEAVQGSARVFNIKKTRKTRGRLISGGGVLITGWIFLFPSRWAYNQGDLLAGELITGILRYGKRMKIEPYHEPLPRKFPLGLAQVRDYDTFLVY